MGGPGAGPARCWAQMNPGHARRGPQGSGPASPPGRRIVGPSSSPPGPPEAPPPRRREMGARKGNGTRVRPGAAVREALPPPWRRASHRAQAHSVAVSAGGRGSRPLAKFPTVPPSRLHLAGRLPLGAGEVDGPGLFPLPFIFQPNTDPVPVRVEAAEERGKETFVCPPAGCGCGVQG